MEDLPQIKILLLKTIKNQTDTLGNSNGNTGLDPIWVLPLKLHGLFLTEILSPLEFIQPIVFVHLFPILAMLLDHSLDHKCFVNGTMSVVFF
jgi:hypothetical protein